MTYVLFYFELKEFHSVREQAKNKKNYLYDGELEYICAKNIYVSMHIEKYKDIKFKWLIFF